MSIQSMTGFARHEGRSGRLDWAWELRSVNGKNLDIRSRLPAGYEELEPAVRERMATRLKRGNIQVSLQMNDGEATAKPRINHEFAAALWEDALHLHGKLGGDLPRLADLIGIKGVVEFETPVLAPEEKEKRDTALLTSLEKAVELLAEARTREGAAICDVVAAHVAKIEDIRKQIESSDARSEHAIRKRIAAHVHRLVESSDALDEQRIHQEAVLLAAKADLQEEIDRLEVHVASARELLATNGPVGRRLDFLAQEFNRECNTICSKSNAAQVTALGLDMKIVIDQFREQIQNLE